MPFNQNKHGWLSDADMPPAHPQLVGDIVADWVVIGAGFAGVAFARRLAHQDERLKIVLIDSDCAAESSSARNSGFVIGLPHNIGSSTSELKKAHSYRSLLQEGIRQLETVIAQQHIDCEWENVGKYHCQVDSASDRILKEYADSLDLMDEPYQILTKDELYQRLGTRFYHQGIYTPGCVLVNPARLISGLADSLPANVTVYNHTPALDISYDSAARVVTPFGTISASKVMLATNALSRKLSPVISRQASMATYASITEPLSAEQRKALPEMGSWGLTPVNAIAGATLRFTRDNRFLIRQHVTPALDGRITAAQTYQATALHRQIFRKIYPQLGNVNISRTWSGTISVTRNGAPVWGKINRFVYTAGGCNGAGVSKQTVAGTLLADYALGQDNPLINEVLMLGRANYLPPSPILDAAIAVSLMKERFMGRKEG